MKVALVHDWLAETRGGAEDVFVRLAQLYPRADIFCLTYTAKKYPELADRKVTTSWLGKLPSFIRRRRDMLTVFAPHAVERLDLRGYDVVISSSSAFAKGVHSDEKALHICYCYSPMRYVWDYWPRQLTERARNPLTKIYVNWLTHRLRLWDYYSSRTVDSWVAISQTVANRLSKYYGVPSKVIYPGIIDTDAFWNPKSTRHNYYITVSTLAAYKKVDLAVQACIKSGRKLMVVGEGPERKRLEQLAEGYSNIIFMGRASNEEKIQYLQEARGLIFASEEDFGIAPLEAVAAGTPVIAYNRGGLTETIVPGKSGLFFDQQSPSAIAAALDEFESKQWDSEICHAQARKYDLRLFDKHITTHIDQAIKKGVPRASK